MADFRTESQKACDRLREAILNGEYPPGTRLPQRKIAARFGSTTIVIREALRLLENEKLVVIEPRYGAMVREVTPRVIRDRYIVREALEGMAARLAAINMTEDHRRRILAVGEECDRVLTSPGIDNHVKAGLHQSFHDLLLELTNCEELNLLLQNSYLHSIIISNAFHIDWSAEDPHRHSVLARVLVSGDPNAAETAMREHVRIGMRMELESMGGPKE